MSRILSSGQVRDCRKLWVTTKDFDNCVSHHSIPQADNPQSDFPKERNILQIDEFQWKYFKCPSPPKYLILPLYSDSI
jgi:hypothetical protein